MTALPIPLPYGFTPLVNSNDTVTTGQALAQNTAPQEEIINIAKELRISVRKARKTLQKSPGDAIAERDVIAINKKFLGLQQEAVISKISGTIVKYERDTGDLYIRTTNAAVSDNIISPVDGVVTLCDNEKIVIAVDKNVFMGTNATDASVEGELYFFEETPAANQIFLLDSSVNGKIVISKQFTRESLIKGIAVGALGFIGSMIDPADLEYIRQKHTTIPVLDIDDDTFQKLSEWRDKKIYLDGKAKSVILLQL